MHTGRTRVLYILEALEPGLEVGLVVVIVGSSDYASTHTGLHGDQVYNGQNQAVLQCPLVCLEDRAEDN